MRLVFTISVECVGDHQGVVTTGGHWLDAWRGIALRLMLRELTFANKWRIPEWIPPDLDSASDLVKLLSPRIEFYARPRSAFN